MIISSSQISARLKFLLKIPWQSEELSIQEIRQVEEKIERAVLSDLCQNSNTGLRKFRGIQILALLIYGKSNLVRLNFTCSCCTIRRGINHCRFFRHFWFCRGCRFCASWSHPWTLENVTWQCPEGRDRWALRMCNLCKVALAVLLSLPSSLL